jgi:hypothetical protein
MNNMNNTEEGIDYCNSTYRFVELCGKYSKEVPNNNNNNHGSTALYGLGPPLASSFRGY